MRPLSMMAGGLALVVLDFRTESLDLLPDPIGWALVAVGSWRLAMVSTSWLAGLSAGLSVADAALPYRYVRIDPITGEHVAPSVRPNADLPLHLEFDPVSGWRLAGVSLAMTAAGVTVWSLLRGLERRATARAEGDVASRLRLGRWLVVVAWVVPYLVAVSRALVVDSGRFDAIWNGNGEYVALVGVAVVAYVIVLLAANAGAGWAQPERPWSPSPWDELRLRRSGRGEHADSD